MTNSTQTHNRLINETSPYLLQHAYNPVDWYPWGDAAFERARRENKPVFLSIGYSTCHWCHVMAHESFEDIDVAKALNADFISVKVDREERPDVDYVYMQACQAIAGAGGWPLSIFLTPDKAPFYAGMYFPKRRAYGRIGFLELLGVIREKWLHERDAILLSAGDIASFLSRQDVKSAAHSAAEDIVRKNYAALCSAFDAQYGGFGDAPKFPTPQHLRFLLKYHAIYQAQHAYDMAEKTLKSMYRGGIFDHIGYGFSRYSTDQYWLVPHFEKMLYDNALLALAALAMYEQKGDAFFLELARKIFLYLFKELKSEEGGFYAAQDADSEGEEGKYYLLSYDELIETLGEEAGRAFAAHYNILPGAKEEAGRIPNLLHNDTLSPGAQNDIRKLYDYRRTRHALHLDDKILAAQNGMVLSALSNMHRLTGEESYLRAAKRCALYIQENLMQNERLYTSRCRGKLSEYGYLDDYAHCALGFLALYNATLCEAYIMQAHALVKTAVGLHFDTARGGFYLSAHDGETLFMRPKEIYDGATPSGNATMTEALFLLVYLGFEDLRPTLEQQLSFMDGVCIHAQAHSQYLYARMLYESPQKKIVCVLAPDAHCKRTDFERSALVRIYTAPTGEYKLQNGKTTYYICENGACSVLRNE